MDLRGKRALVMGLGIHGGGLGVARFLADQGAIVSVTDLRGPEQLQSSLDALAGLPITYVLGQHRDEDFREADLVIRNPGVPRESRYLQIARAHGAAIEMEMTLFFRLCPGPILGITGTKGKTTTTLLTAAMLREQYPDTVVAGNLRVSALEALPRITAGTPVVLELSSWQLEGLGEAKLSPQYACYLNLYPDHLDRYGTMRAYAEAKDQIFLHQRETDVAVFNSSGLAYSNVYEGPNYGWTFWKTPAKKIWFLGELSDEDDDLQPGQHFTQRDAFAAWHNDDLVWEHQLPIGETGFYDWAEEPICSIRDIRLHGAHNLGNIAAAAALAKAFGITNDSIRNAIRNFTGVEHRLEFVREIDGVRYVNDTAATAPEAAIAALRSFDRPIVLIAGGADKNLPLDDLAREIALGAKAVVLLKGSATAHLQRELKMKNEELKNQLGEKQFSIFNSQFSIIHEDFEKAIDTARSLAAPGDVVLLSPGCASFGMFRNEFHRGEEFRRIVHQL
ncbi:MAG TPA: UDP-N-acetylmuramoyl-L-alanine--D-glutamate ligase [Roseiflexaceae bacterium]|nr:UDP-N-acetylmuramoyl-L-alanine--D-glutamate ligase [Roseiflexaceae bacterium]